MVVALLEVRQLDKKFGKFYALQKVSLTIEPGEVHALIGENGAGKSTFIKLITGVYGPDGGDIVWQGERVEIREPKQARTLGINVIHQERHLVPSFTGFENLYLGLDYPQRKFGLGVRWRQMREQAVRLSRELSIDIPLDAPAQHMSPPERTLLEILRAMMLECRLLFLDEPTAALTDKDAEILFRLIERLKAQGTSIVYVSHRLDEVFRLSDRITVLRNGKLAGTLDRGEATREAVVRLMTDSEAVSSHTNQNKVSEVRAGSPPGNIQQEANDAHAAEKTDDSFLQVKGLSTADGKVKQASFHVQSGEIVGLFGLAGAGRTELLEAIYGLRALRGGEIHVEGRRVLRMTPRESIDRGIVIIPEDRRADALILGMTIRENMTLPILPQFSRKYSLAGRKERQAVSAWMEALKVKAAGQEQPVGELSGGNQQKVVFAKALMTKPKLFLCDEPTQAVDVMTREEIHRLLREQADAGCGVLFVSSDLQEVLEIADRIVVMHEGETIAELANESGMRAEQVLQMIYNRDQAREGKQHGTAN